MGANLGPYLAGLRATQVVPAPPMIVTTAVIPMNNMPINLRDFFIDFFSS
jgi:hypothetical protein